MTLMSITGLLGLLVGPGVSVPKAPLRKLLVLTRNVDNVENSNWKDQIANANGYAMSKAALSSKSLIETSKANKTKFDVIVFLTAHGESPLDEDGLFKVNQFINFLLAPRGMIASLPKRDVFRINNSRKRKKGTRVLVPVTNEALLGIDPKATLVTRGGPAVLGRRTTLVQSKQKRTKKIPKTLPKGWLEFDPRKVDVVNTQEYGIVRGSKFKQHAGLWHTTRRGQPTLFGDTSTDPEDLMTLFTPERKNQSYHFEIHPTTPSRIRSRVFPAEIVVFKNSAFGL